MDNFMSGKLGVLKRLIGAALSGVNKSPHEMFATAKQALATYKGFSREWDNLAPGGGTVARGMSQVQRPTQPNQSQSVAQRPSQPQGAQGMPPRMS